MKEAAGDNKPPENLIANDNQMIWRSEIADFLVARECPTHCLLFQATGLIYDKGASVSY